jgi:phosphoglycerate dehydrogenase-like enzyme
VYVVQGRGQRDYADCQAALARVPARMTALSFIGTEDEMIARTRDADALVISSSPVTRGVMSALEGLKVVARTGVGYDVLTGQRPLHVVNPEVYAADAVRRAR